MRFVIAGLVGLMLGGQASAQEVMDGSKANVPEPVLAELISALGDQLVDPYSAQIRKLRLFTPVGADYEGVCGELNAKNGFGGYGGFQPFQYLPKHKSLITTNARC